MPRLVESPEEIAAGYRAIWNNVLTGKWTHTKGSEQLAILDARVAELNIKLPFFV